MASYILHLANIIKLNFDSKETGTNPKDNNNSSNNTDLSTFEEQRFKINLNIQNTLKSFKIKLLTSTSPYITDCIEVI